MNSITALTKHAERIATTQACQGSKVKGPGAVLAAPTHDQTFARGPVMQKRTICRIQECVRPVRSKELCNRHYLKLCRHGDPEHGREHTSTGVSHEWLENHLARSTWPETECIEWPFGKFSTGYGQIYRFRGQAERRAHALVCQEIHGDPPNPEATWTLHKPEICHNRGCVNPNHLRWGTPKENSADQIIDGTAPIGENVGNSVLTEQQVREIRASALTESQLSEIYNTSKSNIHFVRSRKTWAHVV